MNHQSNHSFLMEESRFESPKVAIRPSTILRDVAGALIVPAAVTLSLAAFALPLLGGDGDDGDG